MYLLQYNKLPNDFILGKNMDIIRDNMGIVNIFILCIIIIGIIFIRPIKHVQAQAFKMVGNSDLGTVYIDTDTVEVVKKMDNIT